MTEQHNPEPSRTEEIQQIHRDYRLFYQILGGIILVGIGVLIGAFAFRDDDGYIVNVYTEMLSIGITVFIIDRLYRYREERNAEKRLKEQLFRNAASISNKIAKDAIHQIRQHNPDWLIGENGILKGADLEHARLVDADLTRANLQEARLSWASLQNAKLLDADLRRSKLIGAHLERCSLYGTNFSGADMSFVNLTSAVIFGADFSNADLRGAIFDEAALLGGTNFSGANLQHASLRNVRKSAPGMKISVNPNRFMIVLDPETILPDGSHWSPDRDLREFTDPEGWQRDQNP
jgi:hypothetical protein